MTKELIKTEDLFENEHVVLIKATYETNNGPTTSIDVAVKDDAGQIVNITTVKYL